MVDAILSKLSLYKQRTAPTGAVHVPIQSGSLHHVPGSKRLVVILPYWHSKPARFAAYRQRLHKKGYSTLYYDVEPRMLQAHVKQVLYNFTVAADAMCDEITAIQKEFNLPEIELNAFSLGNSYVGLLVEKLPRVDSLRLIVPGDSLAACLWRSIATQRIRAGLESQGVTEYDLLLAWQPLALIMFAPLFAEKVPNIEIVLGRADKFIPYDRGLRLAEELRKCGAKPEVKTWRGGHGSTVLRYLRSR